MDWQKLTELTAGKEMVVERVRLVESGLKIEGDIELPPLARLPMEEQIFVAAFIKSHGSIKQMEKLFGISYPSVKNRLNRISENFDFIEVNKGTSAAEVLDRLEQGEISAQQAIEELQE